MRWIGLAALSCGVLTAEPQRVVLLNELVRVEAMERKIVVQFPLEQQSAQLEVKFESKRGGDGVRVAVFDSKSNRPLSETGYERTGVLRLPIAREHAYRVELENLRQRLGHGVVDIEVALVFGVRQEPQPASATTTLDPRRRFITIAASLTLFALITIYSAVRLTPPILQRWRGER